MNQDGLRKLNLVKNANGEEYQIINGWQIDEGEELFPVPFTIEWMLTHGFKKDDLFHNSCIYEQYHFFPDLSTGSGFTVEDEVYPGDFYFIAQCNFVHEWQNLYFALTGREFPL